MCGFGIFGTGAIFRRFAVEFTRIPANPWKHYGPLWAPIMGDLIKSDPTCAGHVADADDGASGRAPDVARRY